MRTTMVSSASQIIKKYSKHFGYHENITRRKQNRKQLREVTKTNMLEAGTFIFSFALIAAVCSNPLHLICIYIGRIYTDFDEESVVLQTHWNSMSFPFHCENIPNYP